MRIKEIDGITLKNVKPFRGHAGELIYQGDIIMDGEKIGRYSDDFWAGPMQFNIDDKDKEQEFYRRTCEYQTLFCGMILKGTDMFITDLLED